MRKQQGIIVLVIVILMALSSITYVISNLSADEIRVNRQIKNINALRKAKEALIAHAITNSYRPGNLGEVGQFPCPKVGDTLPEGAQSPNCGNLDTNTIGYFPWMRMGVDMIKDSSGTCLLYAVSPSYKMNNPRMLNADSNGLFQIVDITGNVTEGILPADRPIAIVFAANTPMAAQLRNFDVTSACGKDYGNINGYLDNNGITNNGVLSGNPNMIDQFVHATSTSANNANPLNDQFLTIKKSDVWPEILVKTDIETKLVEVAEALAVCLAAYANGNANRQLPWPAQLDLSVTDYYDDDNYDDVLNAVQGYAGRFPYKVDSSNVDIGMVGINLFSTAGCSAINLPSSGDVIDLVAGEYSVIWSNWKDHFYYALSKKYEPDSTATSDSICNGVNGCVSVNGVANEYAAIVFYSGESINGTARTSPEVAGNLDQKMNVANYIENNNQADFPDIAGENEYQSGIAGNNDVMFCVTDEADGINLTVVPC